MKRLVVVFCGIFFSCNLESQSEIAVTSQSQTVAVSGDYGMLYTMVYAVPETRSDEIAGKNSFRLTAQTSSRSVSANPSSAVFSAKGTGTSSAAAFYGRLRDRETELLKSGASAVAARALSAATEAVIGKSRSFWVFHDSSMREVSTVCRKITKNSIFYTEESAAAVTDEHLDYLASELEEKLPLMREKFGYENDIDGNGKLIYVIANMGEDIFGYFYAIDKCADKIESNNGDILYINALYFSPFEEYKIDLAATLVHEFQHMAFFDTLVNRGETQTAAVWINEGLSMLAEFFCGYAEPHESYITGTLYNQGVSLIEDDGDSVDYGLSLLFMRYLQERFGESFIKGIYSSSQTGTASVEEAVGVDFNTLFEDFVKMILLTGRNVTTDSRYDIPAFNYTEGTAGYAENGFCLYQLIDDIYGTFEFSQTIDLRRSYGMNVENMKNYSFYLFKWSNRPVTLFQFDATDTVNFETGAF